MTEQCTELVHGNEKVTFPGENLDVVNEIDCVEEKDNSLNFTFDHMYACNSSNSGSETTNNSLTGESEVKHLQELLLVHLEFIQQQSEHLIEKEKRILELTRENEMLKQRLDRLERRSISTNHIQNNIDSKSTTQHSSLSPHNSFIESSFKTEIIDHDNDSNLIHDTTTLYTENIYTEDSKSDIPLLQIHQTQSIIDHSNILPLLTDSNNKDILVNNLNTHTDSNNRSIQTVVPSVSNVILSQNTNTINNPHKLIEQQHQVHPEHTSMVTEMHLKQNNSSNINESDDVKCLKSRNLLNRNRSPTLTSFTKLREELVKPVTSKRSKTSENQQPIEVNNQTTTTQSLVTLATSTKYLNTDNNRRSRCRKSKVSTKRKRLSSGNSLLSNTSSDSKKTKVSCVKRDSILTTDQSYYTQIGSVTSKFCPIEDVNSALNTGTTTTNLEVPNWRIKLFTSCYSMEGTENLDDDVFNKRHLRLENDERRRKRWDVQRIREQRHIEKLKQRQERMSSGRGGGSGGGANNEDHNISEITGSLWPSIDDIKFIEITEQLPVTAFGFPIAQFTPSEFSLPWLNSSSNSPSTTISTIKKSRKKGSRRKSTKR